MIRPYLRDLINNHKPTIELDDEANDGDTERGEWKIQLVMQNSCIFTKNFEDTRAIYSASKPVEVFMDSDIYGAIDRLFDFNKHKTNQLIEEANLFPKVLLCCIIIF